MDLLAQRYASPFLILDEFIRLHQLHDFTVEIIKTIADEKVQEVRWQFFLHKVYGMSWEAYLKSCEQPQEEAEMTHEQIGNTISDSRKLVEGFIPS
jgi:hypothetical protein